MSQPFAIRCSNCQSIWEAESLSTLIQCPICLAMLELDAAPTLAPRLDQGQTHELRRELAREMTIQAITRWRQRLLAEQPQLTDLPTEPQPAWWMDQRMIWRGIAIAGMLTLSLLFGPWQLTLALIVASCYAIIVHRGWNQDERQRIVAALREQTLPLLMDLPRKDFAPGGRYEGKPYDATDWLQAAWGNHRSSDIFQILGWQQQLLEEIRDRKTPPKRLEDWAGYLHETKALGG
jgi:hypothetical protein